MGKSVAVAGMLGAEGVRFEGRGYQQERFAKGRTLTHENNQDSGLQQPRLKKLKEFADDKYEDIVSELGTCFTTITKSSVTGVDKTKGIPVEDTPILQEKASTPITPADKASILNIVKLMSRKELEELILAKVVEVLVKQSEAGKYRGQIAELQKQKDKLQDQVSHLHKQVVKMGKALNLVCETAEDSLKRNKFPVPVKLYRTVGLQVNTGKGVNKLLERLVSNTSAETSTSPDLLKLNGHTAIPKPIPNLTGSNGPMLQQKPKPVSSITLNKIKPPLPVATAAAAENNQGLKSPVDCAVRASQNINGVSSTPGQASTTNTFLKGTGNVPHGIKLPPLPLPIMSTARTDGGVANILPKPTLITVIEGPGRDIILTWTLSELHNKHVNIVSYQIYSFASHKQSTEATNTTWIKVGETTALKLPMACTLSRFEQGRHYVFIVRAVDSFGQTGPFCVPRRIFLRKTY